MAVYHRFHIRPRLVNFTVDESFQDTTAPFGIDGSRVEVVFHDVVGGHQDWGPRAGHQIAVRVAGMPDAHMPLGIQYTFLGKYAVGRDEVFDKKRVDGTGGRRRRLRGDGTLFYSCGEHHSDGRDCNETGTTDHAISPSV